MKNRKNKNPLEGQEIRMQKGVVYEPHCKKCETFGFGFHISEDGKLPHPSYFEGCVCPECGSHEIEWKLAAYSAGEVVMNKGWKPKKATPDETEPDWSKQCSNCDQSPIVPLTGMCGPCTFGEADTIDGNW